MFAVKFVLLLLALVCFMADTLGISGFAGKKTSVLLRPLGLVFWTIYALLKLLGG
jgi:hypothetical protein